MRSQLKTCSPILFAAIAIICVTACGDWYTNSNRGGSTPTGPGTINATLMWHVGGGTPIACTTQPITWTASSTAGSTQTKTSNAGSSTSQCEEYVPFEGSTKVTSCGCPVQISFTGLAPGTWIIQAGTVATCSVQVGAGQTRTATLYNDGRQCTIF